MTSFDYIADESVKPEPHDWMEQAALLRKYAADNKTLTDKKVKFIHQKAISGLDRNDQGEHKTLGVPLKLQSFGLNSASFSKDDALDGFTQYSARLLLRFKLISPLLSRDDEPFYLIDNPARKDHTFKSPYLSAAAIKGLSVDAYQRAFPVTNWKNLASKEQERTRAYRLQDHHALRLFGIADDGLESVDNTQHQRGRLRFSPAWFRDLQFIVLNHRKEDTAQGDVPIQFEAVSPNQSSCIEVLYFNPCGLDDSSEQTVKNDLARWLASVASWWPVFGLGGKRLAGYGQIEIESITLQTVNWSGILTESKRAVKNTPSESQKETPPANYEVFLDKNQQFISEQDLEIILEKKGALLDVEITDLDQKRRHSQGKSQIKAFKAWEKVKKKKESQAQQLKNSYQKSLLYWQKHGKFESITVTQTDAIKLPKYPINEKVLKGQDSWLNMAQWMAGDLNE